jgi:hypothetical protein
MGGTCRALLGAVLVLGIAGLGGCGEDGNSGVAKLRVNACDLLTAEDAQAALGEQDVVLMTSFLSEAKGGDPAHCGYNAGSDTTRTVSLEVRQAPSPERARSRFESARSTLSGTEEVGGLGDAAFWIGRGVDQIHVLKGDLHLIITSRPGPDADARAAAQTLAGKALGRIPS